MSNPKNDINFLRARLKKIERSALNTNSLDNLSASLTDKIAAVNEGVGSLASSLLLLSSSTSMSLSESAVALREGLIAIGGTIYDVSSSLSASVEESGRLLRVSLTNLVNQNSESFNSRLDGLDGELDGVVNDITIITGSWDDYTAAVNNINSYTSSLKIDINTLNGFKVNTETFNADIKRKTDAFAQKQSDEDSYVTSSLSVLAGSFIENLKILNFNLPSKGIQHPTPDNYWAYTVAYPIGREPFKIKSYSYMGTKTGNKYWNLEDVITYTKRLYGVDESSLDGYDANNTMLNNGATTQNSELYLKADEIKIEKGRTNLTSPTLTIIGETSETNGYGLDQGQLFIRDEDASTSGLQIGYRWQSGVAEYGRIQAVNSAGGTDLYINPAGGSVRISRLNNHAIDDSAIELNSYGSGDRNSYIDFHSYGNQDYDSRIIRWSGQAGIFELTNTYNRIRNSVSYIAGTIFDWIHAGSTKMYLESNGNLTLAGNLSDERIKTDIATSSLGLEFINNLKPVQFKFIVADEIIDITKEKLENNKIINDGSRKAGVRNHYGFIAQEVKKAAGGKDFAGIAYEPEKDLYKLNHQEFISPMVKAIQELSQKNDYLQKELEEKDKLLQDILLRLTSLENK